VGIGRASFAGFVVLSLVRLKSIGNHSGTLCFIESAVREVVVRWTASFVEFRSSG
jgi:hypothetical protein